VTDMLRADGAERLVGGKEVGTATFCGDSGSDACPSRREGREKMRC
jgi:hypothetical protein